MTHYTVSVVPALLADISCKSDLVVYAALASSRSHGDEGSLSLQEIVTASKISRRRVQSALEKLTEKGWIHLESEEDRPTLAYSLVSGLAEESLQLPLALLRSAAPLSVLKVYLVLSYFQDQGYGAYPSREEISKRACTSVQSVSKALSTLEAAGYLEGQHGERDFLFYCSVPVDVDDEGIGGQRPGPLAMPASKSPRGTLSDPLAARIESHFLSLAEDEYTNIPKERRSAMRLAAFARGRGGERWLKERLAMFLHLKRYSVRDFWREQPYNPSRMLSLLPDINAHLERRRIDEARKKATQREDEMLSSFRKWMSEVSI